MESQPTLPIPISLVTRRYLLFDVAAVSYLRREHNICGVLIGSIPQTPNQNVFLGLPLELMHEEAQLLISKGVAYLVDDARAHDAMLHKTDLETRQEYLAAARKEAHTAARTKIVQKQQAFRKKVESVQVSIQGDDEAVAGNGTQDADETPLDDSDSIFSAAATASSIMYKPTNLSNLGLTPATSSLLVLSSPSGLAMADTAPQTYPLFKHLHDRGYFLSPGLRFGCQYMAYPGDPLRYHSHFLVDCSNWDDEIDLMDVVGGGRLGTGVKKGYLLGGTNPEGQVKTFSIEWAGM